MEEDKDKKVIKEVQVIDISKIQDVDMKKLGEQAGEMDVEKLMGMLQKTDKLIKVWVDTHEMVKENRFTLQAMEETFEEIERKLKLILEKVEHA